MFYGFLKQKSLFIWVRAENVCTWLLWVVLGLEITNNGILLTTDYQGRASGEAFVQFVSDEQTEKALEKNKQSMGHRWVWSGSGGWIPPLVLDSF